MRGFSISVFVSLALTQVLGGNIFNENQDALSEVEKKFNDFKSYSEDVINKISTEKSKCPCDEEKAAKSFGEKQQATANENLNKEVLATARTAIAKGKPLESIDCIQRTELEGKKLVDNTSETYKKDVEDVCPKKLFILDMTEKEANLIQIATKELIAESKNKIEKSKTGIQALKNDALTKIETARKRLQGLEDRIPKPNLPEVYNAMTRTIESKFKEVMETLSKKLQKCIS